jgi:hypothetical protein
MIPRRGKPASNVAWDNRIARILYSKDEFERRHLYLGKSRDFRYPVYLDRRLLSNHAWIHGGTGSRKTSLSFATLITQLIAGESEARQSWLAELQAEAGGVPLPDERCSVVVLDLKGDSSLLWNCYLEAKAAGVPFKAFTNVVGRTSHVFNPLSPDHLASLTTTNQLAQTILQALSAEYGAGFGEAFFSSMNEIVLLEYIRRVGVGESFRDLSALLSDQRHYPGNRDDWKEARHLPALAQRLAGVGPLVATPTGTTAPPEVFAEQIRIPDVLRKSQVVYFYLSTAIEKTTVTAVAKLALYVLFAAAAMRDKTAKQRVYVFIDEFQQVISSNIALLLEQARSMGISLVLAHQNVAQLKASRIGSDLVETVESSVGFEQAFKASSKLEQKRIQETSGEKRDVTLSWFQSGAHPLSPDSATGELRVSDTRSARVEANDIIEISSTPLESLVRFSEGSGLTQFHSYWVPLVSEFHISPEEYAMRQTADWPDLGPGGLPVAGDAGSLNAAHAAKVWAEVRRTLKP